MIIILLILLLLVVLILNALFLYIQQRGSKALGSEAPKVKMDAGLEENTARFLAKNKDEWQIESHYNRSKLFGWFTDNDAQTTVILVHGFGVDHNSLNVHAQLFDKLGCNVLQIDDQAAGKSEGKYLGFGYIESQDLLDWINHEIVELGKEDFFHAAYEETLAPVYGEAATPDNIVIESGVLE